MIDTNDPEVRMRRLTVLCDNCKSCPLHEGRTNVVVGEGNVNADIMLLGNEPSPDDDACGSPFVGEAGKVLDQALEEAGISRDDVFIANVMKCRPPKSRKPKRSEVEACSEYLFEQIRLVRPKVLVTMGNFATTWAMPMFQSVTKIRGQLWRCDSVYEHKIDTILFKRELLVFPTFHPAVVLYDASKLTPLIKDFTGLTSWLEENPDFE